MVCTHAETRFLKHFPLNTFFGSLSQMYSAADHVIIIAEIAFYEKHFIIMYQDTACAIPEPVVTLLNPQSCSICSSYIFAGYAC